jgi:hypothetical protein
MFGNSYLPEVQQLHKILSGGSSLLSNCFDWMLCYLLPPSSCTIIPTTIWTSWAQHLAYNEAVCNFLSSTTPLQVGFSLQTTSKPLHLVLLWSFKWPWHYYVGSVMGVYFILFFCGGRGGKKCTIKATSHLQRWWLFYYKKPKSTHGFRKASLLLLDLSLLMGL